MSTQTKTTDTATFDSGSMSAYNSLQPGIQNGLNQNQTDPWGMMAGNQQLAQGNQQIFDQSQQGGSNVVRSLQSRGIQSNSPLFAKQLQQMGTATRGAQSNMYSNLLLNAANLREGSAAAASQYQPLQTGQTSTSQKSGLGSII